MSAGWCKHTAVHLSVREYGGRSVKVKEILRESAVPKDQIDRLIEILLWFGFLGMKSPRANGGKETYIYDVFYDMKKLKRLASDGVFSATKGQNGPSLPRFTG